MPEITDEYMLQMRATAKPYTVMILKATPKLRESGADKIIWEHGRRNHALRLDGKLVIVCPVNDGTDVCGIGIFKATVEETKAIMDDDPGVQADIFTYELHPSRSFPGDTLPG